MTIAPLTVCLLIAICGIDAFGVSHPKLAFGPRENQHISQPHGGAHGDIIIADCLWDINKPTNVSSPLFQKNVDGLYELVIIPELNVCSYSSRFATSNGKWIFVSLDDKLNAIYSWDGESAVLKWNDTTISGTNGQFTSEDTFMGLFWNYSSSNRERVLELNFVDGEWILSSEVILADIDYSVFNPFTSTSYSPKPELLQTPLPEDTPMLLSKQSSGEWALNALFDRKYFSSDEYLDESSIVSFNGNDTLIYLGGSREYLSSGSLHVAQYLKSNNSWVVARKFHAEDFEGLENPYIFNFFGWATRTTWISQDMVLAMAPQHPRRFNATNWPYGGSVALIYRDDQGKWQAGGSLQLDLGFNDPAETLTFMTTTKDDIIIVSTVGDEFVRRKQYSLYSYPLCFHEPLDVTCLNDVQVTSCDENDVAELDTVYQYDDKCGEAQVTLSNFALSNGKATFELKFARIGMPVGQCTASVVCPKPPQAVSGAGVIAFTFGVLLACACMLL